MEPPVGGGGGGVRPGRRRLALPTSPFSVPLILREARPFMEDSLLDDGEGESERLGLLPASSKATRQSSASGMPPPAFDSAVTKEKHPHQVVHLVNQIYV